MQLHFNRTVVTCHFDSIGKSHRMYPNNWKFSVVQKFHLMLHINIDGFASVLIMLKKKCKTIDKNVWKHTDM